MTRFILRWVINMIGLYAAIFLVPGINPQHRDPLSLLWLALIFGLVNALIGPLLKFLTCPLIALTLGFFVLVVNTLLFALTGWIGIQFGVGFTFSDPWWWHAFLGSLVVTIVSVILTLVLKDEFKRRQ